MDVKGDGADSRARSCSPCRRPRVRRHDHWYGRLLDPLLVAIETQQRQVLAQLRLLRLAVAFHRGGEPLELPDPFAAGMLHVQVDLGTATFRSAETFWGCERRAVRR